MDSRAVAGWYEWRMEQQPPTNLGDRLWMQATRTDVLVSLGSFVVSTGLLTWVAQRWGELTGGSWPASIFVGLAATCILVLVVSAYLVAFRIFKPLPKAQNREESLGTADDEFYQDQRSSELVELATYVDSLGRKVTTLEKSIGEYGGAARHLDGQFGTLDGAIHEIKKRLDSFERRTDDGLLRFATSLRARDALAMITESDEMVVGLASKLLAAKEAPYDQPGGWFLNYNNWASEMSKIDHIACMWQKDFKPFMDVRRLDYENAHIDVPENIKGEKNATKYQTLHLVSCRYEGERDGLLRYFTVKTGEIP
jgi:hypothetical protein